jgi:hypothetical protein
MNCRLPNLASTSNPDTKYGVYICGRLNQENATRFRSSSCDYEIRLKNSGPPLFLRPLFTKEITSFSLALTKHLFSKKVGSRSIRFLRLVTKLLALQVLGRKERYMSHSRIDVQTHLIPILV